MIALKDTISKLSETLKIENEKFNESISNTITKLIRNLDNFKKEVYIPEIKAAINDMETLKKQAKNIDLNKIIESELKSISELVSLMKNKLVKKE